MSGTNQQDFNQYLSTIQNMCAKVLEDQKKDNKKISKDQTRLLDDRKHTI